MPRPHKLLKDNQGARSLLLGNEAIARGILEAGIGFVTTYPGTPASEIGDSISEVVIDAGLYMEYSTNEIVAVEVAAGAANCGVRCLTAMKHVGMNVAADAVMTLAYIGVKAGYVIVTADDPECYSSQNEQDSRFYALLSRLPCLEPSDPQEAKDMVLEAVDLSERLALPVLLRTTTRVNHTRGPVTLGRLTKPRLKGDLVRDVKRMVMVPAHARLMHAKLLEKAEEACTLSENSEFNAVTRRGSSKTGVISSSSAYNYAAEAIDSLALDFSIMKLGMTHPLPEKLISKFLTENDEIIVVEELEPYLELQIRAIAKDSAPSVEIHGKMGKRYFPLNGELSVRKVMEAFAEIKARNLPMDFAQADRTYSEIVQSLPGRPPILCAGCPHRASFYVLRKVGGERAVYATDIGCYALGASTPLAVGDFLLCMGSSIGAAQGMRRATGRDTFAVIGDSTFFHAAIPGLVNAVYNGSRVTLVILDNSTTAMTGHQPHPGTGITGMGVPAERISIEKVAEGCGVKYIKVVDPFDVREASSALKGSLTSSGPSVVILRSPCVLVSTREKRCRGEKVVPCVVTADCTNCMACIRTIGCPAILVDEGKVKIDENLCSGCGLCATICPYRAIRKGSSE